MAKYEDIKKANDEQKRLNKNMDDAVRRVETMYTKYQDFADKRTKEARAYKKQLEAQEKGLDTIVKKVEDQKKVVEETVAAYKKANEEYLKGLKEEKKARDESLKVGDSLIKTEAAMSKFAKEKAVVAQSISGFDQSSLLVAKARSAFEAGDLAGATARLDVANLEQEILSKIATGEMDIADAIEKKNDLAQEVLENDELSYEVREDLIKSLDTQIDKASEINDTLSEQVGLGITQRDILNEQQTALEEQQEALKGIKDGATKYLGVLSNSFLRNAAIAKVIASQIIGTRELAKNLGIGVGEAFKLSKQTKILNAQFAGTGMDFTAAQAEMVEQASDLNEVTLANVRAVGIMSERFGMGANEAAKLRKIQLEITGGSEEAADALTAGAIALAEANDVAPGAVLSDMAANSEEFARFGAEGAKRMALTAVATKKVGIEMSSLVSASRGLLDIENSLTAEMEAEVLLGRELNLETARRAALEGDHLTVLKELAKEFGTVEEFQNLSVLQQEAAAAAANMTVEEMTKMLANQDKITNLKGEELEHFKKTGELAAEAVPIGQRIAGFAADNVNSIITAVGAYGSMKQAIGDVSKTAKSGLGIVKKFLGMGDKAKALPGADKLTGAAQQKGKDLVSKATTTATDKGKDLLSKTKDIAPKPKVDAAAKTAGGGTTSFMKGLAKIDMKKVLMGAAAMVVVAAAVFVFGKAVQEFMNVSWEAVGMAVVSMLALVGAVALLGAIMMSGVGAVAILAGAAAMLIVAAAVYVLGKALQEMAIAFEMMGGMSEQLIGLVMLAPALIGLAAVFTMLGISFLPFALGLMAITPFLPTLIALAALGDGLSSVAATFGFGGGESGADGEAAADGADGADGDDGNGRLIEKMDELISAVKQGGNVVLDGRKVGEVQFLNAGPAGA